MKEFLNSPQIFQLFGSIGCLIALGGSLVAAIFYRGKEGESYSVLNHYMSELGEVGVSKLAWVFNISMILAGISLALACISLGLVLPGIAPVIAIEFGIFYAVCLSLVGVFPMNKPKPHGNAVLTSFRAGLITVVIFSLGIAIQPTAEIILSRWFALAGLPAILSFTAFMIMAPELSKEDNPIFIEEKERPVVWPLVIVEWLIFLTIILWFVLIAWAL